MHNTHYTANLQVHVQLKAAGSFKDALEDKCCNLICENILQYFIRIRTRQGIYGEIWPEPKGVPEGSGHISPYIPRLVLIRIQYNTEHNTLHFVTI